MPLGPYKTWGECTGAQRRKGRSEKAADKICGMLEKQSRGRSRNLRANVFDSEKDLETFLNSRKTIEIDDKTGEMTMKSFLFDDSMTGNYWNLDSSYIPNSMHTVIQKPVVMYKNTGLEPYEEDDLGPITRVIGELDHPPMNDNNVNHLLDMQEPYRVATHRQWVQHPNDGSYWALSTIHDEGFKRKLREEPDVPFFTSPALTAVNQGQAGEPVRDFVFLHTAIVDRPGYGVKRASVSAICTGNKDTCLLHLKRASVNLAASEGIDISAGCPFCTYKALSHAADNIRNDGLEQFAKSHVVMFNNSTKRASITNSSYGNAATTIQPDKKVSGNPDFSAGGQQGTEQQQSHTGVIPASVVAGTIGNNTTNPPSQEQQEQPISKEQKIDEYSRQLKAEQDKSSRLEARIKELEFGLKASENITNGWQKSYNELKARLDSRDLADKRSQVKSLVDRAAIFSGLSREEKEAQTDEFVNSPITIPQLKKWLAPGEQKLVEMQQAQQQQRQIQNPTVDGNGQPIPINNTAYDNSIYNTPQVMEGGPNAAVAAAPPLTASVHDNGNGNATVRRASVSSGEGRRTGADLVRSMRSNFLYREGGNE